MGLRSAYQQLKKMTGERYHTFRDGKTNKSCAWCGKKHDNYHGFCSIKCCEDFNLKEESE